MPTGTFASRGSHTSIAFDAHPIGGYQRNASYLIVTNKGGTMLRWWRARRARAATVNEALAAADTGSRLDGMDRRAREVDSALARKRHPSWSA